MNCIMVGAARDAFAHKESLKNEPKNGRTLFPFFSLKPAFHSLLSLSLTRSLAVEETKRKLDEILILSLYVLCFPEKEVKHIKETFDIFSAEELSRLIRPEKEKENNEKEECFGKLKFNCDALFYVESIRYTF